MVDFYIPRTKCGLLQELKKYYPKSYFKNTEKKVLLAIYINIRKQGKTIN